MWQRIGGAIGLLCAMSAWCTPLPGQSKHEEKAVHVRPIFAHYEKNGRTDNYFLYPFGHAYDEKNRRGWQYLFNLFQYETTLNADSPRQKGLFAPIYCFKKGFGEDDYRGVFPIGGNIKHFLGKEEIRWTLWPFYAETKNREETHRWSPWPLVDRAGGKTRGMGIYPLGGHFYNDEKDERFFVWPLIYNHHYWKQGIEKKAFLPFYAYERGPNVTDVTVLWPFFGYRTERQPAYEERRYFWPFVVKGTGEQKMVRRWVPFYTHSEKKKRAYRKTWFCWPLIKVQDWRRGHVDIHQEQLLYILFWHQEQFEHGTHRFLGSKTHFWPIYSYWDNGQGHKQLQMLSPIDPIFQNYQRLREIYMPVFNLYRYDETPQEVKQTFLFNCFKEKRDVATGDTELHCPLLVDYVNTQQGKCFSFLKGLIEYKKSKGQKSMRLFWIPLNKQRRMKDVKSL